jgi:ketosteroid isomerase-like protein
MTLMIAMALGAALAAEPKAVVSSMFDAFNRHDASAMAKLYAEDARLTSPDFCSPRGERDVVRTYQALFTRFPDIRDVVDRMIAEGDRVAVRFHAEMTQAGKVIDTPIVTFLRVRHGRIIEDDTLFDNKGRPCAP